ncbi:hypothetical protein [Bradyrhizobium sp. Leo170]|uniref:hypothetical protein n=1 Tax=Bradyrhizobium sp. Leo170 TaxID=1571199 RepID=UPI00102EBC4A|nr:hypothetical protein [Bradyrhizobium sp. Leo170]TAI66081.1 hypothetical protein CWO89_09985 [Bradyrhizobium sp. Leo170]
MSEAAVAKAKQPKAEKKAKKAEATASDGAGRKRKSAAASPKKSPAKPQKTAEQVRTEKQTLAMWGLLSEGGAAYGGKLKPRIDPPERSALEQAGLVEVTTVKRAYLLTVTDKGWDWAEQHLGDPLPDNVTGASVLHGWLARLHTFLQARGLRLSDFFVEQSVPVTDAPAAQHRPEHAVLRERIRAAYQEVAGGFDRRLLLRDLRPRLADLDRQQVDSALMQMVRDGEASLMQLDYRPDVTDEDRAASLQIGNEPRHIIWITV